MVRRRAFTGAARWLAWAGLIGSSGCGVTEGRMCTEIGCSPGVTVGLSGAVPTDFTVEVRSEGGTPFTRDCSAARPCGSSIFAPGIIGDTIEVVMTNGDETTTRTYFPTYEEIRPNGPGCEPACLQGTVDFSFPS